MTQVVVVVMSVWTLCAHCHPPQAKNITCCVQFKSSDNEAEPLPVSTFSMCMCVCVCVCVFACMFVVFACVPAYVGLSLYLCSGDLSSVVIKVIYSKSPGHVFTDRINTAVLHHCTTPSFTEEVCVCACVCVCVCACVYVCVPVCVC